MTMPSVSGASGQLLGSRPVIGNVTSTIASRSSLSKSFKRAKPNDRFDLRTDFVATQAVSPLVMVSGSDQFRRTLAGGL